jgi:hypothetical protein
MEREKRQKENIRQVFVSLEFVYYYLVVFSRDSKQFHFLLFSFVRAQKDRGENDKAEVQQIGGEKGKTRLDAISTKNSARCFRGLCGCPCKPCLKANNGGICSFERGLLS